MPATHTAMFWWKGVQYVASSRPDEPWRLAYVQQVMRKHPIHPWWWTGFRREAVRALCTASFSRKALRAA